MIRLPRVVTPSAFSTNPATDCAIPYLFSAAGIVAAVMRTRPPPPGLFSLFGFATFVASCRCG